MTFYSIFYLIIAAALLLYTARHRFDLIAVAALCFIVYTIYCIPGTGIAGFYRPRLSPALYYSVYVQMAVILAASVIIRSGREEKPRTPWLTDEGIRPGQEDILHRSFRLYTIVIALFALLNVATIGVSTFLSGKGSVWGKANILYIISLYGAYPSFAYGIHKRDKFIWMLSLLVELTIFIAGARAFTATLLIMIICEMGSSLWKERKGNVKLYVWGALLVLFMVLYRAVDTQVMSGDFAGVLTTLKDPATWASALELNEPRVIIANYDYVLTHHVHFPLGDVVYRIIDFVPGMTKMIPIPLTFPEYFSNWLMAQENASAGVGGTIWGEGYAMFGWAGIPLLTAVWMALLGFANKHMDFHKPYSYFIVASATYLSWYISRLDFNRVAQSLKVMFLCFLIWQTIFLIQGGEVVFRRFSLLLGRPRLKRRPAWRCGSVKEVSR